jgi:hypothetical protein
MTSAVQLSSQVGPGCYLVENSSLNWPVLLCVLVGMILSGNLQPLVGTQQRERARKYIEVGVTDFGIISTTTESEDAVVRLHGEDCDNRKFV